MSQERDEALSRSITSSLLWRSEVGDRRRAVLTQRVSASLHRGAKRLVLSLPATLKLRAERAFVTIEHREHNARVAEERSEASTAARSAGAKARLVSCERSEPESCRA